MKQYQKNNQGKQDEPVINYEPEQQASLKRLGIDEESWIESVSRFEHHSFDVAGIISSLDLYKKIQNQSRKKQKVGVPPIEWLKGQTASLTL